jgi:hypothetical protein
MDSVTGSFMDIFSHWAAAQRNATNATETPIVKAVARMKASRPESGERIP